jgi:hypothetical protein
VADPLPSTQLDCEGRRHTLLLQVLPDIQCVGFASNSAFIVPGAMESKPTVQPQSGNPFYATPSPESIIRPCYFDPTQTLESPPIIKSKSISIRLEPRPRKNKIKKCTNSAARKEQSGIHACHTHHHKLTTKKPHSGTHFPQNPNKNTPPPQPRKSSD